MNADMSEGKLPAMKEVATKQDLQALEARLMQHQRYCLERILQEMRQLSTKEPDSVTSYLRDRESGSPVTLPSPVTTPSSVTHSSEAFDVPVEPVLYRSHVPGHVRALRELLPYLMEELDVTDDLLDDLIQSDHRILSESEVESIKGVGAERRTDKRRQVIRCLQSKSEEVFVHHFLPRLRRHQSHVADKLEEVYLKLRSAEPRLECIFCQLVRQVDLRHVADAFHSMHQIDNRTHEFLTCKTVPARKRWDVLRTFLESEIWGDELRQILNMVVAKKNPVLANRLIQVPDLQSGVMSCSCSVSQLLTNTPPTPCNVSDWLQQLASHHPSAVQTQPARPKRRSMGKITRPRSLQIDGKSPQRTNDGLQTKGKSAQRTNDGRVASERVPRRPVANAKGTPPCNRDEVKLKTRTPLSLRDGRVASERAPRRPVANAEGTRPCNRDEVKLKTRAPLSLRDCLPRIFRKRDHLPEPKI